MMIGTSGLIVIKSNAKLRLVIPQFGDSMTEFCPAAAVRRWVAAATATGIGDEFLFANSRARRARHISIHDFDRIVRVASATVFGANKAFGADLLRNPLNFSLVLDFLSEKRPPSLSESGETLAEDGLIDSAGRDW